MEVNSKKVVPASGSLLSILTQANKGNKSEQEKK